MITGCSSFRKIGLPHKKAVSDKKDLTIDTVAINKDNLRNQKYLTELIRKVEKNPQKKQYLKTVFFLQANDALSRRDQETATSLLKALIRLDPNNIYLKKKLALEYAKNRELSKSQYLLQNAYRQSSGADETIALALAAIYVVKDNRKDAKRIYQHLIDNKASHKACTLLAQIYISEKKNDQARDLLNLCEKKIPNNGSFSFLKGQLAQEKGQEKLAERYFKRSLKKQPNYQPSAIVLGHLYEKKKKINLALKVYKTFLQSDPNNIFIISKIIQILSMQKNDKKTFHYMERLSGLDPTNLNLKMKLGLFYSDNQRYQEAIGIFEEILLEKKDSDVIIYNLGNLYKKISRPQKAIATLDKIDQHGPLYPQSLLQKARILSDMTLKGKADTKNNFLQFVENAMNKHTSLKTQLGVILANFYENQGHLQKAIDVLKSIRHEKDFGDEHRYYLASLFEDNRDFASSNKIIEKQIAKNPNNYVALNFLGYSLVEQEKRMDEAFRHLQKAIDLAPENGYIRDSLGWYYYKIGDYKKSLKELKKAWSLIKNDATINKHLAIVYEKLKKYENAKIHYIKALATCKKPSEKEAIRKAIKELPLRLPASLP